MEASLCVDSFQSPLDQTLYVVCHSPRSSQRRCSESWAAVLHTDVAFRFRNTLQRMARPSLSLKPLWMLKK